VLFWVWFTASTDLSKIAENGFRRLVCPSLEASTILDGALSENLRRSCGCSSVMVVREECDEKSKTRIEMADARNGRGIPPFANYAEDGEPLLWPTPTRSRAWAGWRILDNYVDGVLELDSLRKFRHLDAGIKAPGLEPVEQLLFMFF
jgi:hypothetical protein